MRLSWFAHRFCFGRFGIYFSFFGLTVDQNIRKMPFIIIMIWLVTQTHKRDERHEIDDRLNSQQGSLCQCSKIAAFGFLHYCRSNCLCLCSKCWTMLTNLKKKEARNHQLTRYYVMMRGKPIYSNVQFNNCQFSQMNYFNSKKLRIRLARCDIKFVSGFFLAVNVDVDTNRLLWLQFSHA